MFRIQKLLLLTLYSFGYLMIFFTFSSFMTPAYGKETTGIPSLGKGGYEVIMFTDYFCPYCRDSYIKAEPLFRELLATGKVKIIFVDVPFSKATPIYARYFLYAVQANASMDNVLHVRELLFEAALTKRIQTADALAAYLKEQKIKWKTMDEKTIFPMWGMLIKQHAVRQIPACIIRYSATDSKKVVGDNDIWNGLVQLKTHIARLRK